MGRSESGMRLLANQEIRAGFINAGDAGDGEFGTKRRIR